MRLSRLLALTGRKWTMNSAHILGFAAAALLTYAAPGSAAEPTVVPTPPSPSDTVPLYTDLGSHHKRISTQVSATQQYFNQGLRLVYGFNHAEAIRSFTRAAALDPTCAMCYWGIALAYGPHVNAPMDQSSGVAAYAAVQKALALKSHATASERAYIEALAQRYEADPPDDRARLDRLYSRMMEKVAKTYPKDLDAATLYAESLMDLRPWNYWRPDGTPYPETKDIVRQLEGVLTRNPNHPGACHYYIHAVEAVNPKAAVPCAERLARLMPGEGHMIHMPSHIYIRVGRWNDAVQANHHAIHTDEEFIEGQRPMGVYPLAYYPHNIHFFAFASTMAGRSTQAIEAASTLTSKVNLDAARQVGLLQEMLPYHTLTLTTFGKWDEVLAEPLPPEDIPFSYTMAQYARGVAHAAKGEWAEAQTALDTVAATEAATPEGAEGKTALSIAVHALSGEIATRRGDLNAGITHFREAAKTEDGGLYFEPPKWYYPIRHSLGAALVKVGQHAEAEKVYREDLRRFPENGWSLFGLAQALRAQGKDTEAAATESRFRRAWTGADVTLTASRF
ncbi:MAG: Tetratricopeptide repeat (TPR) protein [Candidatus Nitrospira kreftii]|uniref:Tetratricopeptide repeat (TPR) protein n=1 Tax=Candidatus Nitrospira kreftii TaxID=2652173 RepID=A0A7S8FEF8_9BACT|nr:MAG: Tetratricopeptide repeat (TPR) protein [Candidatus Nitrospira kreftii]